MIDKELLTATVEQAIANTNLFLVEVTVAPDNKLTVTVDSADGVDIDQCVTLTRTIEEKFDREVEDYELEVGSAGVTAPFKVRQQYEMNIGNPVEVLTRDGRKIHATLTAVSDDFTTVTVTAPEKVKEPGAKRPKVVDVEQTINIDNIKSICYEIKF
jgi:ribosome maturation factor RimP